MKILNEAFVLLLVLIVCCAETYYDILGVDKEASVQDIKKAYKKLALQYHPDKRRDDKEAADKFLKINEGQSV